MDNRLILNEKQLSLILNRLAHQLIENYNQFEDTCIIALQPRGAILAQRIVKIIENKIEHLKIEFGKLDTTFHRDDFRRRNEVPIPSKTEIDFIIENKKVILIDDVLYTGRSVRAALDAMLSFGRPQKVELLVLIDRRFHRHLPVRPDYIGKTIDSVESEKVKVCWKENNETDQVILLNQNK
jgi:pyrimidine operon attenuation protein/uracil phosphoribosyltransferase